MLKRNEDLLQFLSAEANPVSILIIGCKELCRKTKLIMPQAKICELELKDICRQITEKEKNISAENLLEEESFDYIIAADCIPKVEELQLFMQILSRYLKPEGSLLASFGNVRHWTVLAELMEGHWRYGNHAILQPEIRHFFALPEIIKLFEEAKYQEIKVAAQYESANKELLQHLTMCGFANENNDLEVVNWLVKADKVDKKMVWLKRQFTGDIRRTMVFLLRRIENDIESEKNCAALWEVCSSEGVSAQYLAALLDNTMLQPEKVIVILAIYIYESKAEDLAIQLLQEGYSVYPQTASIVYVLASLLELRNQDDLAEKILSGYQNFDDDIIQLLDKIRRKKHNG